MRDPPGPQVEEDLRWDTASAFSLNVDTPWDILRAQLLWSIWCQRVAHTFRDEEFHLGVVLWHAWRNTIFCAMEAYKELFRHKRNEVKRQEVICCFQQIWTAENVFGRLQGDTIRWNVTPPQEFLPKELGAWTVPPIRINRLSPSPDLEAEFTARHDFANLVNDFVQSVGNNWQPPPERAAEEVPDNEAVETTSVQGHGVVYGISPLHTASSLQEAKISQESKGLDGIEIQKEVEEEGTSPSYHSTQDLTEKHRQHCEAMSNEESSLTFLPTELKVDRDCESFEERQLDNERRPHSRPKKCCSRRLKHPSRSKQGAVCFTSHLKVRLSKKLESPRCEDDHPATYSFQGISSCEGKLSVKISPSRVIERDKHKSRSKRKCRFGPRKRGGCKGRQSFGNQSSASLHKLLRAEGSQLEEAISSPPSKDVHQLPDRVTFQIVDRPRRTPFDKYRGIQTSSEQTVNSFKSAAYRLGLSEAEFKDNLHKEIDDLLREIEVTRQENGASQHEQGSPVSPYESRGDDEQRKMAEKMKGHNLYPPPLFQPLTKPKSQS